MLLPCVHTCALAFDWLHYLFRSLKERPRTTGDRQSTAMRGERVPLLDQEGARKEYSTRGGYYEQVVAESLSLVVGAVYTFTPSASKGILQIKIHKSRESFASQIKHGKEIVIRRKVILIVLEKKGSWHSILCCGQRGWINITPLHIQSKVFTKRDKLYRYEDWQGNNYVLLNGRLVIGSDGNGSYNTSSSSSPSSSPSSTSLSSSS